MPWPPPTPVTWGPSLAEPPGADGRAGLPLPPAPPPGLLVRVTRPFGTLPGRAAVVVLGATVSAFVLDVLVVVALAGSPVPSPVRLVLAAGAFYAPLVAVAALVSRRWGTASLRRDIGLAMRPSDLGWGPLTWLSCAIAQTLVAVAIVALGVPAASNSDDLVDGAVRAWDVLALVLVAVVMAPVVEEIVFRGIVLRSLATAMPTPAAVVVQGVLFGAVHLRPGFGAGNLGLALVLSAVGCVLGTSAVLVRRLAPCMIAHALVNGLTLALVLSGVAGTS